MSGYPFSNTAALAQTRMSSLEDSYDRATTAVLSDLGIAENWTCLEVGAGGGSIARWLAKAVGAGGHVVATDIDTRFLDATKTTNLEVRRHDILVEDLQSNHFDLIHSRLVLIHHPERETALRRLVDALTPGGLLVIEEIAPREQFVGDRPWPAADRTFWRVQDQVLTILMNAGCDHEWARTLNGSFAVNGLVEVGSRTYTTRWRGSETGITVLRANVGELWPALIDAGIAETEIEEYLALLDDPRFLISSYPLVSTWGRKPNAGSL